MVEAFQRNHELGLGQLSLRLYSCALAELKKAGQLQQVIRCAACMVL